MMTGNPLHSCQRAIINHVVIRATEAYCNGLSDGNINSSFTLIFLVGVRRTGT